MFGFALDKAGGRFRMTELRQGDATGDGGTSSKVFASVDFRRR